MISLHATLAGELAGSQRMHVGVWGWNNVMRWRKEVGDEGLTDGNGTREEGKTAGDDLPQKWR